jgi:hypothetical protein
MVGASYVDYTQVPQHVAAGITRILQERGYHLAYLVKNRITIEKTVQESGTVLGYVNQTSFDFPSGDFAAMRVIVDDITLPKTDTSAVAGAPVAPVEDSPSAPVVPAEATSLLNDWPYEHRPIYSARTDDKTFRRLLAGETVEQILQILQQQQPQQLHDTDQVRTLLVQVENILNDIHEHVATFNSDAEHFYGLMFGRAIMDELTQVLAEVRKFNQTAAVNAHTV